MPLVTIVYDPKSKRIRARAEMGGWVRFPKALRKHGEIYFVDELREGKAGSFIACGKIEQKSSQTFTYQGF